MEIAVKILIGFAVGTLIGMTGLGGGVLLLPILIFGLKVRPIIAVGSDALFNFVTKIGSGLMHLRKRTVRRKVVLALATGSVPGSILGVSFLVHLRTIYGSGVNNFITSAIGLLLVCIPTLLLFQGQIEEHVANRPPTLKSFVGMTGIGLVAGFLVGMTSVGSGSISLLHWRAGNIDPTLVASLLIGSIPGGLLGSHLSTRVPVPWLRRILCAVLLATGARMLWA